MHASPPALPQPLGRVQVNPAWQRIDFISDIHLQAAEPANAQAWTHHLLHTPADALFILGDLFEVWIGDDDPDPFHQQCIQTLAATARRLPVFFLCGNRDFLAGPSLMQASGMQAMSDPSLLVLDRHTVLLSHGDSLCLDDTDYLAFRAQVRSPEWQAAFLAKPLAERVALARGLRAQSEARKQTQASYADVDGPAACAWLQATNAEMLVHGHTHRPGQQDLGAGLRRWVLSDWQADHAPRRLEVTVWQRQAQTNGWLGFSRQALA